MSATLGHKRRFSPLHVVLAVYLALMVLPFAWLITSSLKTTPDMFTNPFGLPKEPQWGNFREAWDAGVAQYLLNSLIVTGTSVVLIVIISGTASYALARGNFRGRKAFYVLLIVGFAIPIHTVLVPLFEMMSKAGLTNSYVGLILPYVAFGIPFSVLLLYNFFLDFPKEIEEAARMDGCGEARLFFQVVAPLSLTGLASVAIFQAVFIWNEFVLALILISEDAKKTLPFGLVSFQGQYSANWPLLLSSVAIATLPILMLYVVMQRHFVNSLTGFGK